MAIGPVVGECIPGLTLGHFRVLEKIGSGGMGEVFRARDQHLDRDVALKVLPAGTLNDESAHKRFRKEALALSKLNHPNIATVYDFDSCKGVDFLAMEYIPGLTLTEKLAQGPLPEKEIVSLARQMADGLSAAHEHGVIHRDLKSGNLRLTTDGLLKILDFGLAKLCTSPKSQTASVGETQGIVGTLPYLAPEQILGGPIDGRTDIYAAGVTLFEMASGKYPYADAKPFELIGAILHRVPPSVIVLNHQLSNELGRIIGKCLEKERENRYQSAKELAVDLRRLERGSDAIAPEKILPHRTAIPGRQKAALAMAGTCALLVMSILVAPQLRRLRPRAIVPASIAVLPFADLSPGHDHEYFSDGLAEEILNNLTKIPNIKVAARTSAFQFKGKSEDSRLIGQKLDVADILEGSVQSDGRRVRITVRLTRADVGQSLWSESYDREFKDIFAVEDEIAAAVTSALQPTLLGGQTATRQHSQSTSAEAYEAFLQARSLFRTNDAELQKKAFDFVDRAIQADTTYAPAYALRGLMSAEMGLMGNLDLPASLENSRKDAERAIALDPRLAAGYLTLSECQAMADRDWKGAEESVRQARELAPGDADELTQNGFLEFTQGRLAAAAELMRAGVKLDPLAPGKYHLLGTVLLDAGDYADSGEALQIASELSPHSVWAHEMRGEVFLAQGRSAEAMAEMEREPAGPWRDYGEALAYHALGKERQSESSLQHLIAKDANDAAFQVAQVYAYRGEVDRSFAWLERAYRQWDGGVARMKSDWLIRKLQKDPRYSVLLKKMNLPE